MNQLKKTIFRLVLIFLGFWVLFPIIRWVMNLEFATDSIKMNYKEFLFFAVPIAVILTLFGTIEKEDKGYGITGKIIGTVVVAVATIFIMFISVFADMCTWTNKQILYEHKTDSTTKIMVRDFGCGATDSGPPTVEIHKVRYFTKYFIRTTKVDTAKIDKSEWIKIQ